jgi:hypothetical protein
MINTGGEFDGIRIGRGNQILRENQLQCHFNTNIHVI